MKRSSGFTMFLALLLAACGSILPQNGSAGTGIATPIVITAQVSTVIPSTIGPLPTAGPSLTPIAATPIPTLPTANLSPTELKYKVLEKFPDLFFCDPDFYPIARDDELTLAQQRFPELQANEAEFQAILSHNDLAGLTNFTDQQKLLIYREYKKLNAVYFDVAGDKYQFQIQTGTEGQPGSIITGTIDGNGFIDVMKQEPSILTCPICLAAGTRIDTPRGPVPVEGLRPGDSVWTVNEAGERLPGTILRTSRVPVPASHQILHVILSDGRELWASPGHPTADGRTLGDLKATDRLDGAEVVRIEHLLDNGTATYDLLPSGSTGFYWANGVLLGSTLSTH